MYIAHLIQTPILKLRILNVHININQIVFDEKNYNEDFENLFKSVKNFVKIQIFFSNSTIFGSCDKDKDLGAIL